MVGGEYPAQDTPVLPFVFKEAYMFGCGCFRHIICYMN